jgi:methyl-accepting chemotaxis protein
MKNWTIGKRIIFGFATVLVLVVILAVTSALSLRSIRKSLVMVTEDSLPGITAIGEIDGLINEIQIDVLRHMLAAKAEDKKALEDGLDAKKQEIQKVMDEYEKTIHLDEDRLNFKKLQEARDNYVKARGPLLELSRAGKTQEMMEYNATTLRPTYKAYMAACAVLVKWNADYGRTGAAQIEHTVSRANLMVTVLSVVAGVLGAAFAFFIVLGVNRVLSRVAGALDDGADQVASAAGQVSSSSQSLAEGASEQAASLEETSSSLEEMASMTKRNSENASKASELGKCARHAAEKGATDMQAMSAAMSDIKTSSDDIAKIIKTIDEIAFQTNILALNAAVEAARAGEAGMGFAVVADEVRNLAQRSAQAAKETTAKIEGAITKTAQGVDISTKVEQALTDIVTQVRQVDELVAEVAGASKEQTQGITQVNTAVGQMDKVTQSNAANAEETAAAAEELNAQAETMKHSVAELLSLVGGKARTASTKATVPAAKANRTHPASLSPKRSVSVKGNGHGFAAPALASAKSNRQNEIPLEGDFKDF